uniref:Transcription factor protein n=1 Tax=Ciona intestinalis TaxID=7719 RepID=Q4H2L6_CIOIN|nr:transcription factor protein [Ciona intestinalis]BAE06761.1 transcription factor protein [Ciona intestinalis]|eukprot:NP_001071852.1 transcription factor protein [Ciona intestinalis]
MPIMMKKKRKGFLTKRRGVFWKSLGRSYTGGDAIPFECKLCNYLTNSMEKYIVHIKDMHYVDAVAREGKDKDGEDITESTTCIEGGEESFNTCLCDASGGRSEVSLCDLTLEPPVVANISPSLKSPGSIDMTLVDDNTTSVQTLGSASTAKLVDVSTTNHTAGCPTNVTSGNDNILNIQGPDGGLVITAQTSPNISGNAQTTQTKEFIPQADMDVVCLGKLSKIQIVPTAERCKPNKTKEKSNKSSISKLETIVKNLRQSNNNNVVEEAVSLNPQITATHASNATEISDNNSYTNTDQDTTGEMEIKIVSVESCSSSTRNPFPPTNTNASSKQTGHNFIPPSFANMLKSPGVTMPSLEVLQIVENRPEIWGVLFNSFFKFPYPPSEEITVLSDITDLTSHQIKCWFASARMKHGISWSPDEVVKAWEVAQQMLMVQMNQNAACNSATNIQQNTKSSLNIAMGVAPTLIPDVASFITVECWCNINHRVTPQQQEVLNISEKNLSKRPTNHELKKLELSTGLPPCAIMSYYKFKHLSNNPNNPEPSSGKFIIQNPTEVKRRWCQQKTPEQKSELFESFKICPYLRESEQERLSDVTGLVVEKIQAYFRSMRRNIRRQMRKRNMNQNIIDIYNGRRHYLAGRNKSREVHKEWVSCLVETSRLSET